MPTEVRSFAMVGVLGGFTTFSAFTLESFNLLRGGDMRLAMANMLISNLAGLFLVVAGFLLGRFLMHR